MHGTSIRTILKFFNGCEMDVGDEWNANNNE